MPPSERRNTVAHQTRLFQRLATTPLTALALIQLLGPLPAVALERALGPYGGMKVHLETLYEDCRGRDMAFCEGYLSAVIAMSSGLPEVPESLMLREISADELKNCPVLSTEEVTALFLKEAELYMKGEKEVMTAEGKGINTAGVVLDALKLRKEQRNPDCGGY